ncbi:TPA: hypothetical protein SMR42_002780 [Pseudomonas putida]|nr:hypothetical protein [Pseudomonas putida]
MSPNLSPPAATLHQHLPTWLLHATPQQRALLQRRIRESLRATRRLRERFAHVQPVEAFCNAGLQNALAHWYPGAALPDPTLATLRTREPLHDSSWLEAAMQNFEAGTQVSLYAGKPVTAPLPLDSEQFVKGARNLDLGQRYQDHLHEHLDNDQYRLQLAEQDRAAFAAELTLARMKGLVDSRGEMLGEAAIAGIDELNIAPGRSRRLQCSFLSLFGFALHGPLLLRLQPQGGNEPCLLYLPGAKQDAVRQFPSLQAMGQALTRKLWDNDYRTFFSGYVSQANYPAYAARLRTVLFPSYPYTTLYPRTPVLERGESISWLRQAFPPRNSIWQQTLDKNARLLWDQAPWQGEVFAARARQQVLRVLDDAATLAIPVARREAAVQRARVEHWLSLGLTVANVAGLFLPALGAVMLVVGAAQVVEEFLDGVHAANEGDADAAVEHLFGVLESLVQFAALGAAAGYAEVEGPLEGWHLIEHSGRTRLWNGDTVPFSRTPPWPSGTPASSDGLIRWQSFSGFEREGKAYLVDQDEAGRWRLRTSPTHVSRPGLQGHASSAPVFEHERPMTWQADTLLERLTAAPSNLDAIAQARAWRSTGFSEADLRQIVVDHQRPPALLLDSLESFGATRLPPAPEEPIGCQALARQFPGLSSRVRSEILNTAPSKDLLRLQQTGRLPLAIAESARYALRQTRLNRALAAFHLDNGAQQDRDLLAIAQLQRLPGWSGQVRLELRAERPSGPLLRTTDTNHARVTKSVVRRGLRYQPYDETGQALGSDTDLFQALLQALPDSERQLLGLQIHEPLHLRDSLFEQAANDRTACTSDLGLPTIRPFLRLPTRQTDDPRLGYRLSGRRQGRISEEALFDELFPGSAQDDRQSLRLHLREQAGTHPDAFRRLLEQLRREYRNLDSVLENWLDEPTELPPAQAEQRRAARSAFAQRLRSAWRREPREGGASSFDDMALELEGHSLEQLPILPVRLGHVRTLTIQGLPSGADTRLGSFLEAFPNLRHLDIASNSLTLLPPQVGDLAALQLLDLSENVLDLDQTHNLDILTRLTALQNLNMTDAISPLPVQALRRLGQLPRLALLQLDLNYLDLTAEHFDALAQWPALRGLSLGDNDITLTPASRAALARLNRLERLYLYDNPLQMAPDLTGWNHLTSLDLQDTQISDWPQGLTDLLNRQPLSLRELDLSGNDITRIPALTDSAFATAAREDNQVRYSFDRNPLDEQSRQHLVEAGFSALPVLPANSDWYSEWPQALREHIALTAPDEQWQPLYDLFARLPDTAEYQAHPGFVDQRMRHMLTLLIDPEGAMADRAWGRSDLQRQIIDRLEDATQTCVDQASLLFQQSEADVLLWHTAVNAGNTVSDAGVIMDSAAGLLRQQLLDERIGQLYDARLARRRALAAIADDAPGQAVPPLHPDDDLDDSVLSAPNFLIDEVEMLLDARRRLQARLILPAQPQELAFGYLAQLSEATLERVFRAVSAEVTAQRFADWAPQQGTWRLWLRRVEAARFQAQDQQWEGATDYHGTLNEATTQPGPYTGAAVPTLYLQALERELGQIAWQVDGVVQRIDLVSGHYPDGDGIYQRASELLLQTRKAAEEALVHQLTLELARQHLA